MAAANHRLKIGLVIDTSLDSDEGVPTYVMSIGEWLRAQGHDVHYLAGQTGQRDLPNVHSLARNIGVRFNGTRTTIPLPASRRKLRRFIERQQFDVLHVQTPHHPLMAQRLVLAAGPRTAVVGTFHIAPFNKLAALGNKILGLWLRPSLRRFDKIVSVSAPAADFARQTFGIETAILPNVVDVERFHQAKPLPRLKDGRLNILFLGLLVPRKGAMLLLRAAAELAKNAAVPPFRVIICGKGPEKAKLEDFVRQNGLAGTVGFEGYVNEADKPRYYASADIAVFPSGGGESFGIVLLEAMASGRAAVLAGDNPGYRSVMAAQPDLLFDPRDAHALAAKLAEYLRDAGSRRQMADWGAGYAAGFDVNKIGQELLAIYRQALRKRRKL